MTLPWSRVGHHATIRFPASRGSIAGSDVAADIATSKREAFEELLGNETNDEHAGRFRKSLDPRDNRNKCQQSEARGWGSRPAESWQRTQARKRAVRIADARRKTRRCRLVSNRGSPAAGIRRPPGANPCPTKRIWDDRPACNTEHNDNVTYFAAGRLPGTHWHHFDPGLQTEADIQANIIDELEAGAVRYIVLNSEWNDVSEANDSSKSSHVFLLDDYTRAHYRKVRDFGSLQVLIRSGA